MAAVHGELGRSLRLTGGCRFVDQPRSVLFPCPPFDLSTRPTCLAMPLGFIPQPAHRPTTAMLDDVAAQFGADAAADLARADETGVSI